MTRQRHRFVQTQRLKEGQHIVVEARRIGDVHARRRRRDIQRDRQQLNAEVPDELGRDAPPIRRYRGLEEVVDGADRTCARLAEREVRVALL